MRSFGGLNYFGSEILGLPSVAAENFLHAAGGVDDDGAEVVVDDAPLLFPERQPELLAERGDFHEVARGKGGVCGIGVMRFGVSAQDFRRVVFRIERDGQ